jgi:hypothetical protein
MELPPRQHPQQHNNNNNNNGKDHDDALPAKLRVLVDFARHQEEHIKTLEEVSWGMAACVCPSLLLLAASFP